jgi:hypothetical protein
VDCVGNCIRNLAVRHTWSGLGTVSTHGLSNMWRTTRGIRKLDIEIAVAERSIACGLIKATVYLGKLSIVHVKPRSVR